MTWQLLGLDQPLCVDRYPGSPFLGRGKSGSQPSFSSVVWVTPSSIPRMLLAATYEFHPVARSILMKAQEPSRRKASAITLRSCCPILHPLVGRASTANMGCEVKEIRISGSPRAPWCFVPFCSLSRLSCRSHLVVWSVDKITGGEPLQALRCLSPSFTCITDTDQGHPTCLELCILR